MINVYLYFNQLNCIGINHFQPVSYIIKSKTYKMI